MTRIIGIAGTAKNTGKTTTTSAIMERVYSRGIVLGLTSIGLDGEIVDNVTGLPKPRITCENGTYVAIAEACLTASTAQIEIIQKTEIRTALGRLIVGRVKKPGLVVVAGPNKSSELRMVNLILEELGCRLILVDGALNRIAPMVETDGIILATGASRTADINKLTKETSAFAGILNIPIWQGDDSTFLQVGSILSEEMVRGLLPEISSHISGITISGIIGEGSFQKLLQLGREQLRGKTILLRDPIKVLVAGSPDRMQELIGSLNEAGVNIAVQKKINLLCVTINPFYPRYRYQSRDYEPAYIDKNELKAALTASISVPVVNVLDEGIDELWTALEI